MSTYGAMPQQEQTAPARRDETHGRAPAPINALSGIKGPTAMYS